MTQYFAGLRSVAAKARDQSGKAAQKDARVSERLDIVIFGLFVVALTGLIIAGYGVAKSVNRAGAFDPPVVQTLPDERILTNLRDSDAPFVGGGVLGNGTGSVVLLREDGQLAQINEATGLVNTQDVSSAELPFETPFKSVSAGCGWLEPVQGDVQCAEPDRVFVTSEGGGLAERGVGQRWRMRLRDDGWVGRDGSPVEQDDVEAWAASDDGRWITVFAGTQGLAVFDQEQDMWHVIEQDERLIEDAAQGSVFLVAEARSVWIATISGLAQVAFSPPEKRLQWSVTLNGQFRDFTLTADRRRVGLVEGACSGNVGVGCLSIVEIQSLDSWNVLVGEVEKIQSLSSVTTHHVVLQDDAIVAVSEGGIFAYDQDQRSWRTLRSGTVDAFRVSAVDNAIVATMADQMVRVTGGRVDSARAVKGAPFRQIEVTTSGRRLGLSRDGHVRDLQSDAVLAGQTGFVPKGVSFRSGASVGNRVLLAGADGFLIHDVVTRDFQWVNAATAGAALSPLLSTSAKIVEAAGVFWLVEEQQGSVRTIVLEGSFPNITATLSDRAVLRAPFRSANGDPTGLLVVDGEGQPFTLTKGTSSPIVRSHIGDPRLGTGAFKAAAAYSSGLVFITGEGLWAYNSTQRHWQASFAGPENAKMSDIAIGEDMVVLSEAGQVFRSGDGKWHTLIGQGQLAALALSDVSDAQQVGTSVYFAGAGLVQKYSPSGGGFAAPFTGGRGDVRLVDTVSGVPVWVSNGQLFYGNKAMTDAPVLGAWAAADGIVALMQRQNGEKYSAFWNSPMQSPVCTFLGARAPSTNVIDATTLQGDRVLVVSEQGSGIYVEAEHRWLDVTGIMPRRDLRVHVVDGHLVAVSGQQVQSVPIEKIQQPDSCAEPSVSMSWDVNVEGVSVEYDANTKQVAILGHDGVVQRWSNGTVSTVLEAPSAAPNAETFRQMMRVGNYLVFVNTKGLWRYELTQRAWQQILFDLPEGVGKLREVDISSVTPTLAGVTVWTEQGVSFVGAWNAPQTSIRLRRTSVPKMVRLATPAAEIKDIGAEDSHWLVLSDDQLEITQMGATSATGVITFPQSERGTLSPFLLGADRGVAVGPLAAPRKLYLLPRKARFQTTRGALKQVSFAYAPEDDRVWGVSQDGGALWRINARGAVWTCDVVAGRAAPQGCAEVLAEPLRVSAEDVGNVYVQASLTYSEMSGQLVVFDETLRTRTVVAGPQVTADALLFESRLKKYYWEGPGRSVWRIEGSTAIRVLNGVQHLTDMSGNLVAKTDAGYFGFENNSTISLSEKFELRALSLNWKKQQDFLGLNELGQVVDQDGRTIFELAVPNAERVKTVLRAAGDGVWVQYLDGNIQGFQDTVCSHRDAPLLTKIDWPCITEVLETRLSDPGLGDLMAVSSSISTTLVFERGEVAVRGEAASVKSKAMSAFGAVKTFANDRDRFIERIKANAAGENELAPVFLKDNGLSLDVGPGRRLTALDTALGSVSSMSNRWVRWNRSTASFSVATVGNARRDIAPVQFIRNGRMVLDHGGVARHQSNPFGYDWIGPYGIWRFKEPGQEPALVALFDLPVPVGLEAGRVLFADGQGVDLGSRQVSADSDRSQEDVDGLRIGAVWRAQKIEASFDVEGANAVPAFGRTGFLHDQRLAIGWTKGQAHLVTPRGLVNTRNFPAMVPLPNGTPPRRIVRHSGADYAQVNGGWWQHRPTTNSWTATGDPFEVRSLAVLNGVAWSLDRGVFSIHATDPKDQWRVARQGLDFDANQLVTLAATKTDVVAETNLGTHRVENGQSIPALGDVVDRSKPSQTFDALSVAPGEDILFAKGRSGAKAVWDSIQSRWVTPDPNKAPWDMRRVVDGLQYEVDLFAHRPPRAVRTVEHPGGTSRRAGFAWRRGQKMPFDSATAIYSVGTSVYVGTRFGLRVVDGQPSVNDKIIDARSNVPNTEDGVLGINRLGRPSRAASRLVFRDVAGNCVDISAQSGFAACADAGVLDKLYIWHDGLWTWDKIGNQLKGQYVFPTNKTQNISSNPNERWPHDTLNSRATCGAGAAEIWEGGSVIRSKGQNHALDVDGWSNFHCQHKDVALDGAVDLPAGLYVTGRTGAVPLVRHGQSGWVDADAGLAAAITDRRSGKYAFEAKRLRVRGRGHRRDLYEYRPLEGTWKPMAWQSGIPEMDGTRAIVSAGAKVMRVTPLGVVQHTLGGKSLAVNPDTILFRTADPSSDFRSCQVDRVVRLDGRVHSFSTHSEEPIAIRCLDGRILQERPTFQGDVGAYAPVTEDPFAEREAISEDAGWQWMISDDRPGKDATVDVAFRGEPVTLTAGRFSLDDYRSLASPFSGKVNIASEQGLWVHLNGRLGVKSGERPDFVVNAETVRRVHADRDQVTGQSLLCASDRTGASVAYSQSGDPEKVEACRDWGGADGLYQYRRIAEGGASALGLARNGPLVSRSLEKGKFADRVAIASPQPIGTQNDILVPTVLGVSVLSDEGQVTGLYSHLDVLGVMTLPGVGPSILARTGVFPIADLDAGCASLSGVLAQIPKDVGVHSVSMRGADEVYLKGALFAATVRCSEEKLQRYAHTFDVGERDRHSAVMRVEPNATRVMRLSVLEGGATELSDGLLRGFVLQDVKEEPIAVFARSQQRAAIVLTKDEVYLVDVDAGISELVERPLKRNSSAPLTQQVETGLGAAETDGAGIEEDAPIVDEDVPVQGVPSVDPERTSEVESAELVPEVEAPQVSPVLEKIEQPLLTDRAGSPVVDLTRTKKEHVVLVQEALSALGYYTRHVDGFTGPNTRAAIRAYQRSVNVKQTGHLSLQQYIDLTQ